jgi:hypothetical protein
MNQGLCWDAGDTLGCGKAQGRAETSAVWNPSLWKASPWHDLLKEQLVLQAKTHQMELLLCRLWDLWSLGLLLKPTRAVFPKLSLLRPEVSLLDNALKACQPGNTQACTIYAEPCHSGLHRPAQSLLCQPVTIRPAQACMISTLLGCIPKVCQTGNPQTFMISDSHTPQTCTGWHDLCWAAFLKLAKPVTSTGTAPLRPPKAVNHWNAWSPQHQPMPFRHTRATLQRHARSPQLEASANRPVGTTNMPPATGGLQTYLGDKHRSKC